MRAFKTTLHPQRLPAFAAAAALAGLTLYFAVDRINFYTDDPYITLRCARNLAEGHGPVFNLGQWVEGYSNPIWLCLMALGHFLFIRTPWQAIIFAKGCSFLFGLAVLATAMAVTRRFLLASPPRPARWPAVAVGALLVVNPCWQLWNVGGLETTLHSFLLLLACVLLGEQISSPSPGGAARLSLCLALTAINRPEGAMFFVVAGAVLAWRWRRRQDVLRLILFLSAPFVALFGAFLGLRLAMFGHALPNCATAKTSHISLLAQIEPGVQYVEEFLFKRSSWSWFVVAVWAAAPWTARRNPYHLAAISFASIQLAFVVLVGGDWMSGGRFIAPVYPLLALAIATVYFDLWNRAGRTRVNGWPERSTDAVLLRSPESQPDGNASSGTRFLGLALARGLAFATMAVFAIAVFWEGLVWARQDSSLEPGESGWRQIQCADAWRIEMGEWLTRNVPAGATLASNEMGYIPYATKLRTYDCLGLTEPDLPPDAEAVPPVGKFSREHFFAKRPDWMLIPYVLNVYGQDQLQWRYFVNLLADPRFDARYEPVPLPDSLIRHGWRVFRAKQYSRGTANSAN